MRAFLLLNYVCKYKMTLIRCVSVKDVNEAKSFEQNFFQNKSNPLEIRGIASIQLFRERLSDKVHTTTSKGIVGSFESTVFQRNFDKMEGEVMDIC